MNVSDIKSQIKTKQLDNFYIFTGDDWRVQQIYIKQIAKTSGLKCKYIDSISSVWGSIVNTSFLSVSCVFVVRDDIDIINNEKLQEQLNKCVLHDNIIILLLTNADKRTKFYKKYKDSIVDFEHLKPEILAKYIKKEIDLNDRNIDTLMKICEYDYGRCLLEIDKLYNYGAGLECVSPDTLETSRYDKLFLELLNDGAIYQPPRDMIFDFIDSILNANIRAFDLYDECIECGEAIMVMLSVLYNNAKAVLQVQSCDSNNVSKATGLSEWQIKNARKHLRVFSNRELIDIMGLCQKCEMGIKTGEIDEQYAMMYVLANINW